MKRINDPMGTAIAEYHKTGKADTLRVFSPDFDEDEIPVEMLFRCFEDMPAIEQKALVMAQGKILDVGAGAGCHSLALQQMEQREQGGVGSDCAESRQKNTVGQKMKRDVTAIDISPLSVETMLARGVKNAVEQDFFTVTEKYDTILMLMNGIGIVGTTDKLPSFFKHIDGILSENGQLLLDSSDICYVFEDEDGIIYLPEGDGYYGELRYQMRYKDIIGDSFPWLYIDFETLRDIAMKNGFKAELVQTGEHYDYLARITREC